MPGYGMPLILNLFENESPPQVFWYVFQEQVWNVFQEQVFLSMATSNLWMNLQGTAIKIYFEKPRWLPNKLHIAS